MKRMLTIAAVAMIAAASHAITVSWGSSGAAYYGATKLNNTTVVGTAYLLVLEGGSVDQSTIDAMYTDWKNSSNGNKSDVAGPVTSSALGVIGGSYVVADGASLGESGLTLTENTTRFANVFFITQGGQDYYYQSGTVLYDKASGNWNGVTSTLTVKDTLGNPTTWTAIPEPTSMALFGLGAAVLGLRRRFKKKV